MTFIRITLLISSLVLVFGSSSFAYQQKISYSKTSSGSNQGIFTNNFEIPNCRTRNAIVVVPGFTDQSSPDADPIVDCLDGLYGHDKPL